MDTMVDTRSIPKSKFASQYDASDLRRSGEEHGIQCIYLSKQLGGRPEGEDFYDADGHVSYARVAESGFFQEGMSRLEQGIQRSKLALLCSEENPSVCHRRLLIARVLRQRGFSIDHIRADGTIQSEEELLLAEAAEAVDAAQLALFDHSRVPAWKSIPSVLPRKRPNSSSAS